MLMSSEKEFSIIPQKWGIKYSIQLTFIECLLWACCWVRLINISWTRLILGKMKSWLLLFVQSSFPPTTLDGYSCQRDSDIEQICAQTNLCTCVGALHCAVLCLLLHWLPIHLSRSHASAWFLLHPALFLSSLQHMHMALVSFFFRQFILSSCGLC